ncbi:MAG: PAS domain S-box protein [Gammaproteobacteria bacterium]|nr:PAS domain S-box protein [Gammaproteobacteria bacterium]
MKSFIQLRNLFLSLLFVVLWGCMYWFLDDVQRREQESYQATHTAVLTAVYQASIERLQLATKFMVDQGIRREEILKIFARGVHSTGEAQQQARDELYRLLLPWYQYLKAQGIQLVQFHTRDAHSFLRFHLPDQYGDSLRDARPALVQANTNQKIVTGFEIGRVKSGFRNVFPISYHGEHLGSVEISLSFDQLRDSMALLEKSKYYQLILRKKAVFDRLFEEWRAQYPPSEINQDFVLDKALSEDTNASFKPDNIREIDALLRQDVTLAEKMARGENFSISIMSSSGEWCISFVAVIDTLGKKVGYFISYEKDSALSILRQDFFKHLIVGTLMLLGLYWAICMLHVSRTALKREKQRLEVIMSAIGDGLYVMDNKGVITQVNNAFTELLGYEADEVVGRLGCKVFHRYADSEQTNTFLSCPIHTKVSESERYFGEERFLRKDGGIIDVEINSRPISDKGIIGSVSAFRDISEQTRLKEESQAKQRLIDSIVENIPNMIFLKHAKDLRFAMFNKAGEDLLGYDRSELLGKSDYDFFPREQADFFTGKDREILNATGVLDIPVEPIETHQHGSRLLHTKKLALRNDAGEAEYLLGISEDITELHQYRQHLEELVEARTAELKRVHQNIADTQYAMDKVGIGITWADFATGRFTYSNPYAAECLGYTPEELCQLTVSDIDSHFPAERYREIREQIKQRSYIKFETTQQAKDGRLIPVEMTIYYHAAEGSPGPRFIAFQTNISTRKEAERALRETKESAEAANLAKSLFLANMSHEIRTPMNGVIGMTDVLLNTRLTDEQRKMTRVIRDSAQTQLGILNDILDFSKIEAGKLEFSIEPFALAEVVEKTCATLAEQARSTGVTLRHTVDAHIPPLEGDALRVRQILSNFLSNAIKFSSGLGRTGNVEVVARRADGVGDRVWIELAVRDNGIGMDTATRERVFHPFTQADASTTRQYGGTGLGLVISTRLAAMMGGEIRVESTPEVGSAFIAHLPFSLADPEKLRVTTPETPEAADMARSVPGRAEAVQQGRLILVAEDNATNQEVIQQQLMLLGYRCDIAPDGRAAFRQWLTGEYGLILSDLHMPHLDGYQLAEAIRREEANRGGTSHTPILALTANVLQGEVERCQAAGMDGYLAKPVPLSELREQLTHWLSAVADPRPASPMAETPALVEATGDTENASEPPVFDPGALTQMVGDKPAIHRRLLEKFQVTAQAQTERLRAALTEGDAAAVGQIAHGLKSNARAIGALQLGDLCEKLEQAGKAGDTHAAQRLTLLFEKAYETGMTTINTLLDR